MENNMRFLSNIFDHRKADARMSFCCSFHAWRSGQTAMDVEWQHHLDWINENTIGPPKATKKYTQKQLEDMGMIGLYAETSEGLT